MSLFRKRDIDILECNNDLRHIDIIIAAVYGHR